MLDLKNLKNNIGSDEADKVSAFTGGVILFSVLGFLISPYVWIVGIPMLIHIVRSK